MNTADRFDIAPFALPNTPPNEVRFEEWRDIVAVEVEFAQTVPDGVSVSYLRKTWPESRWEERAEEMDPARLGWSHIDDSFNPEWQPAATSVLCEGSRALFTFEGLAAELPDMTGYDVSFRRTVGLRIDTPDAKAIQRIAVFTVSPCQTTSLRVVLDAGGKTPCTSLRCEGYNLTLLEESTELDTERQRECLITVDHMVPSRPLIGDDPLLTFHLDTDAFTINVMDLTECGPIWFEDMGVFIAHADDTATFEQYRERHAQDKTLTQQVIEHSEQSLAGAYHGQPRPHCVSTAIGCKHARQRFRIEPNGDIDLEVREFKDVPGKDSGRVKQAFTARYFFGLEDWRIFSRFPDPDPVLVYNIHARRGDVEVEQKTLAVPLLTSIQSDELAGDEPVAALVRFRFTNRGDDPADVSLPIRYAHDSERTRNIHIDPGRRPGTCVPRSTLDPVSLDGTRLYTQWEGEPALRCALQTDMDMSEHGDEVRLGCRLEPGETCEVLVKIPFIALESDGELAALDALDFDVSYAEVTAFWRNEARRGARVSAPEPQLGALHDAHLAHVFISDFAMPDDNRLVNSSVGTATYGNYTNESCMVVDDLDQRGLHEEARRRLEVWLKYQGTVPQPGNFTDYDGMFYGAGGYEAGSYNQHHGWALWSLCEHYFLTGDGAWFNSVADAVIQGADWAFRQRRNTMCDLPHSRGWEHGFLPAGSLEDVQDFHYWLSTNCLIWRGTEWAARALAKADHPEAERVRKEADAFRDDLIRGFETMRQHAPLVPLRDGRWVPQYPSRLYVRGRDFGWIRQVLEGSVYLILSGLYDANSREAGWILDDFQDNLYPMPPYGYAINEFDHTWFHCAGFSVQPNLLAGLVPYLHRDEPEVYIWMFYNAWASCYREEIAAMVEHPLPWIGQSNDAHFKTSDEANAVAWLRHMFVYTNDDALHLGRAIPRAW
ncbi:MAG: hypothetical protein GY851_26795, partial [bacterium]|nr:hypothetical protein [bacterium]